jgi:hypothetical protein
LLAEEPPRTLCEGQLTGTIPDFNAHFKRPALQQLEDTGRFFCKARRGLLYGRANQACSLRTIPLK